MTYRERLEPDYDCGCIDCKSKEKAKLGNLADVLERVERGMAYFLTYSTAGDEEARKALAELRAWRDGR